VVTAHSAAVAIGNAARRRTLKRRRAWSGAAVAERETKTETENQVDERDLAIERPEVTV
jgi:hypothetical protein